jgi:hypothetical protein
LLPLVAAIVLLYVSVAVGLMDKYHLYPATPNHTAQTGRPDPQGGFFLLPLLHHYCGTGDTERPSPLSSRFFFRVSMV